MPNRILSDEQLLEYVPYAPAMARQYEIERETQLAHATAFARLEALELKGLICSISVSERQRVYYRPVDDSKEYQNGVLFCGQGQRKPTCSAVKQDAI